MRWLTVLVLAVPTACSQMGPSVVPDPDYAVAEPVTPPLLSAYQGGAIFQADTATDLFRDTRAYRVGDILTVTLVEQTDAQVRSSTSTAKDDSMVLSADLLFGIVPTYNDEEIAESNSDASRNFNGTGTSSQSNSLQGSLTVIVARVFSNGNLEVRGEKIVSINQGSLLIDLPGAQRQEINGHTECITSPALRPVSLKSKSVRRAGSPGRAGARLIRVTDVAGARVADGRGRGHDIGGTARIR